MSPYKPCPYRAVATSLTPRYNNCNKVSSLKPYPYRAVASICHPIQNDRQTFRTELYERPLPGTNYNNQPHTLSLPGTIIVTRFKPYKPCPYRAVASVCLTPRYNNCNKVQALQTMSVPSCSERLSHSQDKNWKHEPVTETGWSPETPTEGILETIK
ncbi:hypothetical protein J6590_028667 [Homalodisca vitripennis]|nr:hypothetical protein J6590_028667 [Homalodisca vitripennis]